MITEKTLVQSAIDLRKKVINHENRSIRLASFTDTKQHIDISNPIICNGYSRIHTFSEKEKKGWVKDPLPTIPASKKLKCSPEIIRNARVLQLSACNIRCWYCFVDYANLSPNAPLSKEILLSDIISCLHSYSDSPFVLDLSGGNPGLVPEWILWVIEELIANNYNNVYVWSDDNLTISFYERYLSNQQICSIVEFPRFGSVGCFKGFDEESFSFNTGLPGEFFKKQFSNFKSLLSYGWDLYGYVTFTTPNDSNLEKKIDIFINDLQNLSEFLPLRVIPLEIKSYIPTKERMSIVHERAITNQFKVLDKWINEIDMRFSRTMINTSISEIPLGDVDN